MPAPLSTGTSMSEQPKITVNNVKYHRNGICGEGFFAANITWQYEDDNQPQHGVMIAFPRHVKGRRLKPTHYALTTQDVTQTWRGDHFIDAVWAAIEKADANRSAYR